MPTRPEHAAEKGQAPVLPDDQHNRKLVENVRPPDWENPEPSGCYNLVVIGAGTAGLVTAAGAAGLGAKVALIEKNLLGGDCLNVGCVPSKALIRAARVAAEVRRAGEFGVSVSGDVQVDFPAVMERMRRLRAQIAPHDSAARFRDLGVDVFLGPAEFLDGETIQVEGRRLKFKRAAVTTGARPAELPISGLKEAGYLTNESVFSLTELPRRLAVIGGGPIGCELAQTFARFGAAVQQFEVAEQILTREDADAARIVEQALRRDGVNILLEADIRQVNASGSAKTIVYASGEGEAELTVDEILLGAGRAPNVQGLGLDRVGVRFDEKSGVHVNDRLQTSNPRIFAAGDVCSQYKFTHAADAMARILIQNALFFGRAKASALTIPWCTYTDPEIAHVGLSAQEARQQGIDLQTFVQPLDHVDRAILDGQEEGFVKIHVKPGTDKILGATVVAAHAGEMLSEITLAMGSRLGLKTLASTIHPYPTQSEAVKKVGDAYNRTRLTPLLKSLFRKWLAWTR